MTNHLKSKQEIAKDIWNSHPDHLASQSLELLKHELADLWVIFICPAPTVIT